MQVNKTKKAIILAIIFIALFSANFAFASDSNGTIDPSYKYAWGENLGWLNFGCDNCNVHVTDTGLTGYAWSKQYGWINLAPSTTTYVTNNCDGTLGGYAWSSNLGWINFSGASIDFNGKFNGISGIAGTQTGRIKFDCDNCNVQTDWRQCALRASPAQVIINSITNNIVPNIVANVTMTNEGSVDTEYPYEWCVVNNASDDCSATSTHVFYASAEKDINVGQNFITNLPATVPNPGNYYFKLVIHYGADRSVATFPFTAQSVSVVTPPSGGGGGGGSYYPPAQTLSCNGADFNHDGYVNAVDFSILLYYWKTNPPYKNICVDVNKDNKVDSVDFSIMLAEWGKWPR
jgi:hypothetical protein